jgi:hypothetical protein
MKATHALTCTDVEHAYEATLVEYLIFMDVRVACMDGRQVIDSPYVVGTVST